MATVVIDAGHGGSDFGAAYLGRKEKDDTLRLALAVGNILEAVSYTHLDVYKRQPDTVLEAFHKIL